jgi:hypothetical protein
MHGTTVKIIENFLKILFSIGNQYLSKSHVGVQAYIFA